MRTVIRSLVLMAVALAGAPHAQGADAQHASHIVDVTESLLAHSGRAKGATTPRLRAQVGSVSVVEFDGPYDRLLASGETNAGARAEISKLFHTEQPSDYDFLVVFSRFPVNLGPDTAGVNWSVSNAVQGIGRPSFQSSTAFGSSRLLSYIDMKDALGVPIGSGSPAEDRVLDTLMHELMHQWSAHLHIAIDGDPYSSVLLGRDATHWSALLDTDASVMYGSRWQQIEPSRYRTTGIREGYGPLDLYAAGFLAPEELADFTLLSTAELDPTSIPQLGLEISATPITFTIADIVAAEQPRFPGWATAQKSFNAGLVLLVRSSDPTPTVILDRIEQFRRKAQERFAALTLGRGILLLGTEINDLLDEVGAPAQDAHTNGCGETAPVSCGTSVEGAVSWLLAAQRANGSWRDKPQTVIRDTVSAVTALTPHSASAAAITLATAYLEQAEAVGADQISDLIASGLLSESRENHWIGQLLQLQSPNGGFAQIRGLRSSALDTANALNALVLASRRRPEAVPTEVIAVAFAALTEQAQLLPFGPGQPEILPCWSRDGRGACDLATSVTSVTALAMATDDLGAISEYASGLLRFSAPEGAEWLARLLLATAQAGLAGEPLQGQWDADLIGSQTLGGWDSNVAATAQALLWLTARDRADLVISAPAALAPAEPVTGQLVRVSVSVGNVGVVGADASNATVAFRPVDAPDTAPWIELLVDVPLPPLGPAETTSFEFVWDTLDVVAGDKHLRIQLDTGNTVMERDERNNTVIQTLVLQPAPALAELVFSAGATVTPQVVSAVPTAVEISALVENLGLSNATGTSVRVSGSRFGQLVPLLDQPLSLSAQSRLPLSLNVNITDPDISAIVLTLDPDNAVVEANEANNRIQLPLDQQPAVDLAIDAVDLSLLPSEPQLGQASVLQVLVHNRGTRSSPPFSLRVRLQGEANALYEQQLQLPAAQSAMRVIPWTADRVGPVRFEVDLDPSNAVVETDEGNNHAELDITVADSLVPNLIAVSNTLAVSPSPALAGTSAIASVEVRNGGSVNATAFSVGFYSADPDAASTQAFATIAIPQLAGGASQIVQAPTPTLAGRGSQALFARVDPDNAVVEANEYDNDAVTSIIVLARPDLHISAAALRSLPSSPAPGDAAVLEVNLTNIGEQSAHNFQVSAEYGQDGSGGPIAPSQMISELAAGEQRVLSFAYVRPVQSEALTIKVSVDPTLSVPEANRSNNTALIHLQGQDPNLYLTEYYISPNGDGVQDSTEIVARLDQAEDVVVRILTSWGVEVFRVQGEALNQTTLVTIVWDGRRSDGRRALDDQYQVRIENLSGELLGTLSLVVDTNRSPLVEALTTGHQQTDPLGCAFVDGNSGSASIDSNRSVAVGALEAIATINRLPNEDEDSVFLVPLNGEPPRRLVRESELIADGQSISQIWSVSELEVGVIAKSANEQLAFSLHLVSGLWTPLAWDFSAEGQNPTHLAAVGSWDVFSDSGSSIVAFNRLNGERRVLSDGNQYLRGDVLAVGSRSILIEAEDTSSGGLSSITQFSLDHAPRPLLALAPDSNTSGEGEGSEPIAIFLPSRGVYIISSGYRHYGAPTYPIDLEQVVEINEGSGESTVIESDTQALVHRFYTLAVAPNGNYWYLFDSAPSSVTRIDSQTGERVAASLEAFFDPEAEANAGDGAARAMIFQRWSPDGSALYFQAVSQSFFPTRAKSLETLSAASLLLDPQTMELSSIPALSSPQALQWLRGEQQLVNANEGVAVERGMRVYPLFGSDAQRWLWPTQSGSRHLIYNKSPAGQTQGCDVDGTQSQSSAANGLVRLRLEYVDAAKTYLLYGTARDRNFQSFSVSYRSEDLGQEYQPLFTGAVELDDTFLGSWSPPAGGRYRLRLSLRDQAGNITHYTVPATWFSEAPVGLVRGNYSHISPNGDGVQDSLGVEFELRTALSFDVAVANAQGLVLRTETVTKTSGGSYLWSWDGRDQSGTIVGNGSYQVRFYDRTVNVIVDTTYPAVNLTTINRRFCEGEFDGRVDPIVSPYSQPPAPSLEFGGDERYWKSITLERRAKTDGATWQAIYGPVIPILNPQNHYAYLSAGQWSRYDFRVVAIDLAGNRTEQLATPEGLIVTGYRWPGEDWGRGRDHTSQSGYPADAFVVDNLPSASVPSQLSVEFSDSLSGNSEWFADFYISTGAQGGVSRPPFYSGGSLRKVENVPVQIVESTIDILDGGTLANRCVTDGARIGLVEVPSLENGELFVVQIRGELTQLGDLGSDFVRFLSPSGLPPLGSGLSGECGPTLSYCEKVGSNRAAVPGARACGSSLPWLQTDYFARDPILGTSTQLTLLPESTPDRSWFDISGFPVGEIEIDRRVTDLRSNAAYFQGLLVAHDGPALPVLDWESPEDGASVCADSFGNVAIHGRVDADFLDSVTFQSAPTTSELSPPIQLVKRVDRQTRPDARLPLSSISPLILQPNPDDVLRNAQVRLDSAGLSANRVFDIRISANSCVGSTVQTRTVTVDLESEAEQIRVQTPRGGNGPPYVSFDSGYRGTVRLGFSPISGELSTLSLQALEPLIVSGSISAIDPNSAPTYDFMFGMQGWWRPLGNALREITLARNPAGPIELVWDGRDSLGDLVADGEYGLQLQLMDDCGHLGKPRLIPIFVDNTAPTVNILQPMPSATADLYQPVQVEVVEPNLSEVEVAYRRLGDEWRVIERTRSKLDVYDFLWHTDLVAGDYDLRVRATDKFNQVGEDTVRVFIPARSLLLRELSAAPELISPNADGAFDLSQIDLRFNGAARLSLTVVDLTGAVVQTLLTDTLVGTSYQALWDGRSSGGLVVEDGDYRVRAIAVDPADSSNIQEQSLAIKVDSSPPELALRSPLNGYVNDEGDLVVEITDANFQRWEASSLSALPHLQTAGESAGFQVLTSWAGAAEGEHSVLLKAFDKAGNRSEQSFVVIVDRTLPDAYIATPTLDALVTRGASGVAVSGLANDEFLQSWTLEIVAEGLPPIELGVGDSPVNGLLGQWPAANPDGPYELHLRATDLAGNQRVHSVPVELDNTPPTVEIASPTANAFVGATFAVTGTAADLHLQQYRLHIAPRTGSSSPDWQFLAADGAEVLAGSIANVAAPGVDGPYVLRLQVEDAVGLVAEAFVDVDVDTLEPTVPLGLTAVRQGLHDVLLSWSASASADVVGYRVFRDGQFIAEATGTSSVDTAVAEGSHRYRVTALDRAGNESAPSNEASVRIDTTPPEVRIESPQNGQRVRGELTLHGRAYSREDFDHYVISARHSSLPGGALQLVDSGNPIASGALGAWDSRSVVDGPVEFVLEAWDYSENRAEASVIVTIDNTPPAAPTGVLAVVDDNDVTVSWQANSEPDLAGYLVYRGPRLLNGNPSADPVQIVTADLQWSEIDMGDGLHEYRVVAVDTTGNISTPSAAAVAEISGHPPHMTITRPTAGAVFDSPQLVRATTLDQDIAQVFLESRPSGGSWTALTAVITAAPFESTFTPPAEAYGPYEIRARAIDSEALEDPNPDVVQVEYRDLTPPAAPTSLQASVDGGNVSLSWAAVGDTDLDRYRVMRRIVDSGAEANVGEVPAGTTAFVDSNLGDADYRYVVRALDTFDNLSTSSPPAAALVHTPTVEQPYAPDRLIQLGLRATSSIAGTAVVDRQVDGNTTALPEHPLVAGANLIPVDLLQGVNSLSLRASDTLGNRSKSAQALAGSDADPSAPSGLAAVVTDYDVALTWQSNPEVSLWGYRLYRRGAPVLPDQWLAPGTVTLNPDRPGTRLLPQLADGNPLTTAGIDVFLDGAMIELDLSERRYALAIELAAVSNWDSELEMVVYAAWEGIWIELPSSSSIDGDIVRLQWQQAYPAAQLRVLLRAPDYQYPSIGEIRVQHRPLIEATSYGETLVDGSYRYRLSAVNQFGFEGPWSEAIEVGVGDATPPDPVVLSGSVTGASASLNWTASASPDLLGYQLYRRGALIHNTTDLAVLSYLDTDLSNGQYDYQLYAYDAAGNAAGSNVVVLNIAEVAPGVPINLQVVAVDGGGALALSWNPGPGPDPIRYRVKRSLNMGGPFAQIQLVAAPAMSHVDSGLVNGTRYYYVIAAEDAQGNLSADSPPVSGLPFSDQRLATPAFLYPTQHGRSVTIAQQETTITGYAEADSSVLLGINQQLLPNLQVPAQSALRSLGYGAQQMAVSPSGGHAYLHDSYSPRVVELVEGGNGSEAQLGMSCGLAQWLSAQRLLICDQENELPTLRVVDPDASALASVMTQPGLRGFRQSRDGQRIVVLADFDWADGSRHSLALRQGTGPWQELPADDPSQIDGDLLRFDPSGRWLLLRRLDTTTLTLFDLQTATAQVLDLQLEEGVEPGYSPIASIALVAATGPQGASLYQIDLPTGLISWVDIGLGPYLGAAFDPTGQRAQVLTADRGWELYNWPALQPLQAMALEGAYRLHAIATGEALISTYGGWDQLQQITPAGLFRVDQAPLSFGENTVAAISQRVGQPDSLPALPITVLVPADGLPDLEVRGSDLSVLPNSLRPGDQPRLSARIRNRGSGESTVVAVQLQLYTPSGPVTLPSRSLSALLPGQEGIVSWTLPALADPGLYFAQVQVDPTQQQSESTRTNNTADLRFSVSGDGLPLLLLEISPLLVAPLDNLYGSVQLIPSGLAVNGQLRIRIVDDLGNAVLTLLQQGVSIPSVGSVPSQDFQWIPGQIAAGLYRVEARLSDASGTPIAQSSAPFSVGATGEFLLTVQPDLASLPPGSNVGATVGLNYTTGNQQVSDAQIRLRLETVEGDVLAERIHPLPQLDPGFSASFDLELNPATAVESGQYVLRAELWNDQLLAEAAAVQVVADVNQPPRIVGNVQVPAQPLPIGFALQIPLQVSNNGGTGANPLPIRASIRRSLQSAPLAELEQTLDLAVGATWNGQIDLAANALGLGSYLVSLSVMDGPHAGVLDYRGFQVVDAIAPSLTLTRPIANAVVTPSFNWDLRVRDLHSAVAQVRVRQVGGSWRNMTPGIDYAGQFRLSNGPLPDGDYAFEFDALDTAGNRGQLGPVTITVDGLAPQITINGVTEGGLYNNARSVEVQISDAHLATTTLSLDGGPWVSPALIDIEGAHQLYASAVDAAGNRTDAGVAFTIDLTPPALAFTQPTAGATVNAAEVTVAVATEADAVVTLQHASGSLVASADPAGTAVFAAVPLVAGDNLLRARAGDLAGNESAEIDLLVIRSQSTVEALTGELSNLNSAIEPPDPVSGLFNVDNIGAFDLSAVPLRVELRSLANGLLIEQIAASVDVLSGAQSSQAFNFNSDGLDLGDYLVTLSAQLSDAQGQLVWLELASSPVALVDLTAPSISVVSPAQGAFAGANLTVLADISDLLSGLDVVSLEVDGQPAGSMSADGAIPDRFVAQLSDLADGSHQLRVQASDLRGNLQIEPAAGLDFVVDATPPVITITGVADEALLNVAVQIEVSIADDNLDSQSILLDGAAFTAPGLVDLEGPHLLQVEATDLFGNSASRTLQFTLDFTAPALTILEPADQLQIIAAHVPVVISTEPGIQVVVSGESSTQTQTSDVSGLLSVAAVPLNLGPNLIAATATDRAGNRSAPVSVHVRRVRPSQVLIEGQVNMQYSTVNHGDPVVGGARLGNGGNLDPGEVSVLVDVYQEGIRVDGMQTILAIPPNVFVDVPFSFDSSGWALGPVNIQLRWSALEDPESPPILIDQRSVLIRDGQAPNLTVLAPIHGSIVSNTLPVRAEATDVLSAITSVGVRINGGAWQELSPDTTPNQYVGELVVPSVNYSLVDFRAIDSWQNETRSESILICRRSGSGAPDRVFDGKFEKDTERDPRGDLIHADGFEGEECTPPPAFKRAFDWLLDQRQQSSNNSARSARGYGPLATETGHD